MFGTFCVESRWIYAARNGVGREVSGNREDSFTMKVAEYQAWYFMFQRCYNPKYRPYRKYGAKGIGVADRWRGEHGR
jgi:hypothetical protein